MNAVALTSPEILRQRKPSPRQTMPDLLAHLHRERLDELTHSWVDEVYADRRTDLSRLLSFRELVEFIPEIFDELSALSESEASVGDVIEAVRRLRVLAQTRFQQGALIDEVARELMILRHVTNGLVWQEASVVAVGSHEIRGALDLSNRFFDELIAQTLIVYAVSLRPTVRTRDSVWPPPRGRRGPTK